MVTEFELLNEQEEKVFDVEIQQGDLMEEFGIKIFGSNSDIALCSMYLESDMEIKGLVLKITLPPGNMIGSVMEMKGMSKITFIKNEKNEMVYQVFTHRGLGGFGWTTSAKILNPEGNEKLGDLQINKQQGPDLLSITVNLPKTKEVNILNKALVLGSVLVLIKDY
ncbi:uncharacterized protein LOC118436085 [Folsomia candida]|nr:uncharacterized protein LOC118436085 [Folsomia candida]